MNLKTPTKEKDAQLQTKHAGHAEGEECMCGGKQLQEKGECCGGGCCQEKDEELLS